MKRLPCLLLVMLPSLLFAREWQVIAPESTLGFEGAYQGEAFTGRFSRFEAEIRYDPDNLDDARFDVSVDLASADTANPERDEVLQGSDFFDVVRFPKARFTTREFERRDGQVIARGELALHGQMHPVALDVQFSPDGETATLAVKTTLQRQDFGLGSSDDWADIDPAVKVSATLKLEPR